MALCLCWRRRLRAAFQENLFINDHHDQERGLFPISGSGGVFVAGEWLKKKLGHEHNIKHQFTFSVGRKRLVREETKNASQKQQCLIAIYV